MDSNTENIRIKLDEMRRNVKNTNKRCGKKCSHQEPAFAEALVGQVGPRLWCPQIELNYHLSLRGGLFYPLNYEDDSAEQNCKKI